MRVGTERLRQALVGWIYPPSCGACDVPLPTSRQLEKPFLCEACEATLLPVGDDYCSVCGQGYELNSTSAFRCGNCGDRELAIDFVVSAFRGSGAARELVHHFKYWKQRHLCRLFGTMLDEVWRDERLSGRQWWVVPVPLHPRRMRERGFNQSLELARELVKRAPAGTDLTLKPLLRRVKQTVRQAQLDRRDRLVNLSGVFATKSARAVSVPDDTGFLLVDDVVTTGTTVSECAAVLRSAFAVDRVAAVSVLRG